MEDEFVGECECEPIGDPVFVDFDGKKFYTAIIVHNIEVKVFDCARIVLESDDGDDNIAFCQILAIYEPVEEEKGVMVEARWYKTKDEVIHEFGEPQLKKMCVFCCV